MYKRYVAFFITLLLPLSLCTEPCRLDMAKRSVREYYEQGQYAQDLAAILKAAQQHFSHPAAHDKQIVIFDVDEVALSNYPFFKEHDFGSTHDIWSAFLATNHLPAVPAMKMLYDHFCSLGYKIVFLTSRNSILHDVTKKNLIAAGYTEFEKLIMRNPEMYNVRGYRFKEEMRTQLVAEGCEIACCIDDLAANLKGAHVGYAIKIPNELYS